MSLKKSLSSLLVLGAVAIALPSAALADAPRRDDAAKAVKGDREKSFPVDGAKFKEHVEKRIEKMRARITKKLDEKKVSAEARKTALANFEAGAKKVRDAASRVAADGKVTKEEAQEVRAIAKSLRKDAHGKRQKKADA